MSSLPSSAGDAQATARYWDSLTSAARQALIIHSPHLIGNADGVAAADRDVANRTALHSDIDYLSERDADDQLSRNERDQLANARDTRDVLADYAEHIDPVTGEHLAHLLVYKPGDLGGNGGVAVSLGDPDTADNVSALVPGLTSKQSSLRGNLESMERLRDETDRLGDGRTTATIAWIDYDAPSGNPFSPDDALDPFQDSGDLAMVSNELKARAGGERFADFISGLRASDDGDDAHVTAIGHSYGSTTAAHAAAGGLQADDLVLIGSPGAGQGTTQATDLMANGHVWVGAAEFDPVSHLGNPSDVGLGLDPAQRSFGAHRFEVDPGSYRLEDLLGNHTSYFDEDSTSLREIASICVGRTPALVDGRVVPGAVTLPGLVEGSATASSVERLDEASDWAYDRGSEGAEWVGERAEDLGRTLDPRRLIP